MDRIDEIRARLAAATPGKWKHNEDATVVGVLWTQVVCRLSDRFDDDLANHAANAALITNAPADLAYLLEEVERLVHERAALQKRAEQAEARCADWVAGCRKENRCDAVWRQGRADE